MSDQSSREELNDKLEALAGAVGLHPSKIRLAAHEPPVPLLQDLDAVTWSTGNTGNRPVFAQELESGQLLGVWRKSKGNYKTIAVMLSAGRLEVSWVS